MNEPVQLAPMLAAFEDDGDLTIRISDQWKGMAPALLKLIGDQFHPRRLTLITPTDTKVFKLNGKESSNGVLPRNQGSQRATEEPQRIEAEQKPRRIISQDSSAPPSPEVVQEEAEEFERQLKEMEEAERLQQEQQRINGVDPDLPEPEPAPKVVKRSRERPEPDATAASACGRCFGTGKVEAGGACPVCRGSGAISHWGKRRRG